MLTGVCSPNPCFNGGICSQNGNTFVCQCVNGYTGTTCTNLSKLPIGTGLTRVFEEPPLFSRDVFVFCWSCVSKWLLIEPSLGNGQPTCLNQPRCLCSRSQSYSWPKLDSVIFNKWPFIEPPLSNGLSICLNQPRYFSSRSQSYS